MAEPLAHLQTQKQTDTQKDVLELETRVCQWPTERERTEAGCYSYHKMRAEPQKGSAPFPASGAPHSPRAQLPWA